MSFMPGLVNLSHKTAPFSGKMDLGNDLLKAKSPPPPPGVPNPNDAMNAAQSQTDAMRMRRGLMSNIYAGNSGPAPAAGKVTLGT